MLFLIFFLTSLTVAAAIVPPFSLFFPTSDPRGPSFADDHDCCLSSSPSPSVFLPLAPPPLAPPPPTSFSSRNHSATAYPSCFFSTNPADLAPATTVHLPIHHLRPQPLLPSMISPSSSVNVGSLSLPMSYAFSPLALTPSSAHYHCYCCRPLPSRLGLRPPAPLPRWSISSAVAAQPPSPLFASFLL